MLIPVSMSKQGIDADRYLGNYNLQKVDTPCPDFDFLKSMRQCIPICNTGD